MAKPSSWQKHVWKWYKKLRNTLAAHSAEHALIKSLLYNIQVQLAELTMTNRIQPHPNPPYLKSDGTLNVNGQIKLYVAGTTTAKIAYKDVAGTSYGSTIDLNSSGLPEDGPIYWDNAQLYKVEVYTRTDDTPTYALDYTVDNYGDNDASDLNTIVADTTWTVDGVGASATTFATIEAALDEARNWIIMGAGGLTISINNATYLNETPDFSHPQGRYLHIVGQSAGGVILEVSEARNAVEITNTELGTFENIVCKSTGAGASLECLVVDNSNIYRFLRVELDVQDATASLTFAGIITNNSYLVMDGLVVDCTGYTTLGVGVLVSKNSTILQLGGGVVSTIGQAGTGLWVETGSSVSIYDLELTSANYGVIASNNSSCTFTTLELITMSGANKVGVTADTSAVVFISTDTFDGTETTQYTPVKNTIASTTAGSADTAIIYA